MSLVPIVEEYIYEFSKAIGDAYTAIKTGIGDENTPSTALFEVAQLRDLANRNLPRFGILEDTPSGFQLTPYPIDNRFVQISSGNIGYNGNRINVPSQRISLARIFSSTYSTTHVYGVKIGFPLSEAIKSTTIFVTTLSQSANPGAFTVFVSDLNVPISLGFPIKAYIDTEFVLFIGIDDTRTGLKIDPTSGGLNSFKPSGTKINFIYDPKVYALCGLPVDIPYQASSDPNTFSYYPLFPPDWLSIADVLVINPNLPSLLHAKPVLTPVRCATTNTTDVLFGSYNNATQILYTSVGVGTVDSFYLSVGDRILIKDLPSGFKQYQGVYIYGGPDTGITSFTRSSDLNSSSEFVFGLGIGVTQGAINANREFSYQGVDNPIISPPTTSLPFSDITIDSFATVNKTIIWPTAPDFTPLFNSDDTRIMLNALDATRAGLRQIKSSAGVADLINAFQNYTNAIADSSEETFNAFWGKQPFRTKSNFVRGISFGNLDRIEFPDSFAEAYFDATGTDVQHTFAIFRGDLYDTTNLFNAAAQSPSNITLTPYQTNDATTSLVQGTYTYALTSINKQGESFATYNSVTLLNNSLSIIEIKATNVVGANSYNIYRRATTVGEQNEFLITTLNQITGLEVPDGTTITSSIPVSDASLTLDLPLDDINYFAINYIPVNGTLLGGLGLKFKLSFSDSSLIIANGTDFVQVNVYTNVGGVASTLIASGTPIYYNNLTTTYQEHIIKFNATNVSIGSSYLITLLNNRNPFSTTGTGTINVDLNYSTTTSNTITTGIKSGSVSAFPVLGNYLNNATWIKTYGFLDNGVVGQNVTTRGLKLTGNITKIPRSLSVFVPDLVLPSTFSFFNPVTTIGAGDLTVTTPETPETKNGLVVTVIGRNGVNGTPITFTATVPKGTPRNTRIAMMPSTKIDRIDNVSVIPSPSVGQLRLNTLGRIDWSVYDLVTIETIP